MKTIRKTFSKISDLMIKNQSLRVKIDFEIISILLLQCYGFFNECA